MPTTRHTLLLLQLPRLDPDVVSPGENVMLAAACLQSALARSAEGKHWRTLRTPAAQETADNATLLAAIVRLQPDVIGATLYLWNIERTLRLLAELKQHLPQIRTVVGGPEVAKGHPLLFSRQAAKKESPRPAGAGVDVAVIGEGEAVFPGILSALRRGRCTDWTNVAWMMRIAPRGGAPTDFIMSAPSYSAPTGSSADYADLRRFAWSEGRAGPPHSVAATAGRGPRPAAAATEDGGSLLRQGSGGQTSGPALPNSFASFGSQPPPMRPLVALVPPASHPILRPDAHGMAYLETNRGCPMRCAFCCYNLRRKGWSSLPPAEVERRIRTLRRRGAREIRLVDPTFNAHPRFRELLGALQRANADRKLKFFVELRADTLTDADVRAMAAANIAEAEVGVQSTDPTVLRCIHRPTNLERTLEGIRRLQRHGIKPTIDFMYGLPRQGMDDIRRSLAVLASFPQAHPQFLPTLLLPGTELRDRARQLGLQAQELPPYRVQATDCMSARQLATVEALAQEKLGGFDTPTRKFVGRTLPDLFGERVDAGRAGPPDPPRAFPVAATTHLCQDAGSQAGRGSPVCGGSGGPALPNCANRRAVIFRGRDLFAQREAICACVRDVVRREPDILWQFVLAPQREEPLDLLDSVIATVRALPSHWLDRLVSPPGELRLAARRVFVLLPRGRAFEAEWIAEAEELLGQAFH
jgi:radical SAM superfamily enzyme YgiQ (UPF0313 family)